MPFNEALFWFGLTAFGAGIYFIFLLEPAVRRPYSVGMTVIGALACAYSVYRYHYPDSGLPAIHLWVILLVLTWALLGYDICIGRFRRLLPPPPEKPNEPSKLVIHSALYGAGGFKDVSVTDQLNAARRDALLIPVDNNLVLGSPDPAPNQVKRLEVKYSYGNAVPRTISRNEYSILILPEDSEIERLTGDVKILADALAQARTPQQPQNTGRRYSRQVFTLQRSRLIHLHPIRMSI